MSAELEERVKRLEKQVSDLCLALGCFALGSYNGYLDGGLGQAMEYMATARVHASKGGFVGIEITGANPDPKAISFSLKFKVVPIGEVRGTPTVWERIEES